VSLGELLPALQRTATSSSSWVKKFLFLFFLGKYKGLIWPDNRETALLSFVGAA
jgi:hypothetical protein